MRDLSLFSPDFPCDLLADRPPPTWARMISAKVSTAGWMYKAPTRRSAVNFIAPQPLPELDRFRFVPAQSCGSLAGLRTIKGRSRQEICWSLAAAGLKNIELLLVVSSEETIKYTAKAVIRVGRAGRFMAERKADARKVPLPFRAQRF